MPVESTAPPTKAVESKEDAAPAPAPSAAASSANAAISDLALLTVAGAGSGALTKTATAPLERIKIIFQGMGKAGEAPKYSGIWQTAVKVVKEEGPLALWKGNAANVLRVIPVYGLKFGFNDTFKKLVAGPEKKKLGTSDLMIIGTMSGLFQNILTYPLETVRTRLTLGSGMGVQYKGIADCFKTMIRVEGFSSLYKGLVPTILSGSPYTGLQMTAYELSSRASPGEGKSLGWQLLNGAFSGLVAQTVTYPGDTVRRRMQNNGAGGVPRVYKNSWDCMVKMARDEGFKSFFKGGWTNTVRALPGAAIQFASYEFSKKLLGLS